MGLSQFKADKFRAFPNVNPITLKCPTSEAILVGAAAAQPKDLSISFSRYHVFAPRRL